MTQLITSLMVVALGVSAGRAEQRPAAPSAPSKPAAAAVASAEVARGLTNEEIVAMVQAGLGESVVIAAVRSAKATAFDTAPAALISLKKNGVSDAIVAMMIDPAASPSTTPVAPAGVGLFGATPATAVARIDSPTAPPEIAREPGIYWDKGRGNAHELVILEPNVFSQGKSGGFLTSALTYGIKKINWKAVVRGSAANFHINEPQPTFYFYFESKGAGLGNTGGFSGWLSGATSPNEFVLARMTSKSKERELVVGELGTFGGSSGTRSRDTIDIVIDRLSGGIYRVKAAKRLEVGEYCFFYAGGVSTLGLGTAGGGKLFDFGIYEPDR